MAESDISSEERLRQQAQQRLERRRRKMQSPEERLALITGRPVIPQEIPDSVPVESHQIVETETVSTSTADDPPLEILRRETPALPGEDLLSSLLGGGEVSQSSAGTSVNSQLSDGVWVMLGLVVRIILDTEYSSFIGHNVFLPFALTLSLTISLGYLNISPSTGSTILSAALMLCGVQPKIIGYLTKSLSFLQQLLRTGSLYLFTFIASHVLIIHVIDYIF